MHKAWQCLSNYWWNQKVTILPHSKAIYKNLFYFYLFHQASAHHWKAVFAWDAEGLENTFFQGSLLPLLGKHFTGTLSKRKKPLCPQQLQNKNAIRILGNWKVDGNILYSLGSKHGIKSMATFKSIQLFTLVPSEAPGITPDQEFRLSFRSSFPCKGTEDH